MSLQRSMELDLEPAKKAQFFCTFFSNLNLFALTASTVRTNKAPFLKFQIFTATA